MVDLLNWAMAAMTAILAGATCELLASARDVLERIGYEDEPARLTVAGSERRWPDAT